MRKKICLAVIVACLGFIWINSFFPADISGEMSGFVTRILKGPFRDGAEIAEGLVRKFAHGIEYAALGTAMAAYAYEALARRLSLIGLLGLLTAVIDETIQIFSPGRTSQIKDVWIDFGGFAAGVLLVFLIRLLRGGPGGRKRKEKEP